MKMKKNIMIVCMFAIVLSMAIFGCATSAKRSNFNPIESKDWKPLYNSNSSDPRLFFECHSFRIEAHFITIEHKTYAVGLFVPIIPVYDKGTGNAEKQFKLSLVLDGSLSNIALSDKSITIEFDKGLKRIKPISYEVRYGSPKKRENYYFTFDILTERLHEFTVIFNETVGSCTIPPLRYEYIDLGLEYEVLAN